jgi:SAM-dependent methyltransferase
MTDDYRQSHLEKGADYDRALAGGGRFDAFMTERETLLLPALARRLFPDGPGKYLDFACGTGRITSLIAPLARDSVGVDVSATMVAEAARKCLGTRFILRDITTQPLDERDFDLATAFRFFGNAQNELRQAVFNAVSRHLRPGGYFVFNNHRNPESGRARLQRATGRYEDHAADLDLATLQRQAAAAGLRIERMMGIGWWQLAHRFDRPSAYRSSLVRLLEPVSTWSVVAPLCPAYIVVARKGADPV